jgi:hypothetical protein
MVTPTDPITITPTLDGTLALQTISMVTVRTAVPQPGTELLPVQYQVYQNEQQARARAR